MKPDTSKSTARPWQNLVNALAAWRDGGIGATSATDVADAIQAMLDERVNGWEALEAERDRLQAALLRVMSEPSLSRIDCQLLAAKALQP